MSRRCSTALALALAVALWAAAPAAPPAAQAAPAEEDAPPGSSPAANPAPALGGFLPDPIGWTTAVFNQALVGFMRDTSLDVVQVMSLLLDSRANVISQTPAELSYDNEAVRAVWGAMRAVANGLLAAVALWGGLSLIVGPHVRAPYHAALELLPRLALGALLVNTSFDWGRFVIKADNALCESVGSVALPAWGQLPHGLTGVLVDLIALLVYLVMGLLLLVQMLGRLALVDVLLAVAPLALLCWVLPQTHGWARWWLTTFVGTVFGQFLQVLVLQLGTALITRLPQLAPEAIASPQAGGRVWVVGLLLAVAVLHLARKVPHLVPGYFGLGDGLGLVRFVGYGQVVGALGGAGGAARVAGALAHAAGRGRR